MKKFLMVSLSLLLAVGTTVASQESNDYNELSAEVQLHFGSSAKYKSQAFLNQKYCQLMRDNYEKVRVQTERDTDGAVTMAFKRNFKACSALVNMNIHATYAIKGQHQIS